MANSDKPILPLFLMQNSNSIIIFFIKQHYMKRSRIHSCFISFVLLFAVAPPVCHYRDHSEGYCNFCLVKLTGPVLVYGKTLLLCYTFIYEP